MRGEEPGELLYVGMTVGGETMIYYRFRTPDRVVDFYNPEGSNSRKFLMRKPVANGDSVTTARNTPVTIAVLANDFDADGDALTVAGVSGPSSGTATLNPDSTVTYTPAELGTDIETVLRDQVPYSSARGNILELIQADLDLPPGVQPDMTESGWPNDDWPALFERVREAAPDLILTVGGGTPIDTVKILQLCLAHGATRAEDLERLRQLCDEHQSSLERGDLDAASECDFQFHQQLTRAARNELLLAMLDSISDVLREVRHQAMVQPHVSEDGLKAHRRILKAVSSGDPKAARDAMARHLADAERIWRGENIPAERPRKTNASRARK